MIPINFNYGLVDVTYSDRPYKQISESEILYYLNPLREYESVGKIYDLRICSGQSFGDIFANIKGVKQKIGKINIVGDRSLEPDRLIVYYKQNPNPPLNVMKNKYLKYKQKYLSLKNK